MTLRLKREVDQYQLKEQRAIARVEAAKIIDKRRKKEPIMRGFRNTGRDFEHPPGKTQEEKRCGADYRPSGQGETL